MAATDIESSSGTLTSSMTGDEVLIDGMPVGNLFAFGWNSKSRYILDTGL